MTARKKAEPSITPFPEMRTLEVMATSLKSGDNVTLFEPVMMTRDQARDLISEVPIEKELPGLTAGLMLHPYGFGYAGTPFCFSPDPRVTCFPQGPGPDDDPRGFVCVCVGPDLEEEDPRLPPGGLPFPEPCVLEFQLRRGRFRLGCRKVRCSQTCRLSRTSSIGRWILGCSCGP